MRIHVRLRSILHFMYMYMYLFTFCVYVYVFDYYAYTCKITQHITFCVYVYVFVSKYVYMDIHVVEFCPYSLYFRSLLLDLKSPRK